MHVLIQLCCHAFVSPGTFRFSVGSDGEDLPGPPTPQSVCCCYISLQNDSMRAKRGKKKRNQEMATLSEWKLSLCYMCETVHDDGCDVCSGSMLHAKCLWTECAVTVSRWL